MASSRADGAWRPAALALIAELERRGLVGTAWGHGAVRVHNPAGEPAAGDPLGRALGPGMRQEVLCRRRDGVLWWWWAWSGPTRQSPPELEPLCPVADAVTAVERIAHVLAVPFVDSPATLDASPSDASLSDGSASNVSSGGGG